MSVDSLSWDVVKLIIGTQQHLAVIGISVLVGVALLIIGTNFYLAWRESKKTAESLKSEITTKANEIFGKLTERLDKKADDEINRMKERTEKLIKEVKIIIGGETCRLHARDAEIEKNWTGAAIWWARALINYASIPGVENLLRLAVTRLNKSLTKCTWITDDIKKEIKESVPFIPELLLVEKKEILNKLENLPSEIPKQTETK